MKLIANWKDLAKVPPSETHTLEIEDYCGWIRDLKTGKAEYLSTHTFYGKTHEYSTKRLQSCGFDIQLKSWDELTTLTTHK